MATTTIPVAGDVKVPVARAIIAVSVCPTPFVLSNTDSGRAGQQLDGLETRVERPADVVGLDRAELAQVGRVVRGMGLAPDGPDVEHPAPGDRGEDAGPDAVGGLAEVAGEGGGQHVLEAGGPQAPLGLELGVGGHERFVLLEQLGVRCLDLG